MCTGICYVNLLTMETTFLKSLSLPISRWSWPEGEHVGDLKGRSKATAFTLGRMLWLTMVSKKDAEMP